MPKKKKRQQIKERRQRVGNIMLLIFLFLSFLFFLSFSIISAIIHSNINAGNLKQYAGNYEIRKSNRSRNVVYFIYLQNGDVLRLNPDLLEYRSDFLYQHFPLSFTYSAPKVGLIPSYTCVEIADINGTVSYLSSNRSLQEATAGIYLGAFFSILLAAAIVLVIHILVSQKVPRRKKAKWGWG